MGTFPAFPIPESPPATSTDQSIFHSGLHNASNAWLENEAQRLLSTCDTTGTAAVDTIFDAIYALATSGPPGAMTLRVPAGTYRFTRPSYQSLKAIRMLGAGIDRTIFKADFPVGYATIATATHSGSTVTITTTSPHGFTTGDRITVAEVVDGYNGTTLPSQYYTGVFVITKTGASSFTYTATLAPPIDAQAATGICGYSMFVLEGCRRPTFEDIYFMGSLTALPVDLICINSLGGTSTEKMTAMNCVFGGEEFVAPSLFNHGNTARNGIRAGGVSNGSDKMWIERCLFESLHSGRTMDQIQSVWSTGIDNYGSHCDYAFRTASNWHEYSMMNNRIHTAEVQVNGTAQVHVTGWDSEAAYALYFDIPDQGGGLSVNGKSLWLIPSVASGVRTGSYVGSVAACHAPLKLEDVLVHYQSRTGSDRPSLYVRGAGTGAVADGSSAGSVTLLNTSGITYTDLDIQAGTDPLGLRVLLAADELFTRTHLTAGSSTLPATQAVDLEGTLGLAGINISGDLTTVGVPKVKATFPTGDVVTLATEPAYIPTDLSGLVLWLAADAGYYKDGGSTLAANGETIQQWNDQSGGARNATQATGANRPTYVSSWTNSLPALSFDGTNDNLATATQALSGATAATIFLVFDRDHTDTAAIRILFDVNGTGIHGLVFSTNAAGTDEVYFGAGNGTTVDVLARATTPGDGPMIAMGLFTDAAYPTMWKNGLLTGTAATALSLGGVAANSQNFVGSQGGSQRYFKGKLGELFAFSRLLTTYEQIKMLHYCGRRYGITVP